MFVSHDIALESFDLFDDSLKAPSIHPDYVMIDAKRHPALKPSFFIFQDEGELFYHGFHISPVPGTKCFDIQSPYGYGGPIASCDNSVFLAKAWRNYIDCCQNENILVEFVRFHPLLANWKYYHGEILDNRSTVYLDFAVKDLFLSYTGRARTAIRKSLKCSLSVEWRNGESISSVFSGLYFSCMHDLQADNFYYFNQEYINSILSWEHAYVAVCVHENKIIASAIFLVLDDIIEYHLSAASELGKKFSATNLLIHEAALLGQKLGCKFMHLGGGTDNRPDNQLLFFKSSFSSYKSSFKIGKYIHQPAKYEALLQDWQNKNVDLQPRILFYS